VPNPSTSATAAVATKGRLWASLAAPDGVPASDGKWQQGKCELVLMAAR
jgi:hypothetical protein